VDLLHCDIRGIELSEANRTQIKEISYIYD